MAGFFSPRIDLRRLSEFCRRLGASLTVGVDVRKTFTREVERSRGRMRAAMQTVSDQVNRGSSLADAFQATDDYFPELFRELVRVGEETGKAGEMFRQLADDYEFQYQNRARFIRSLFWPGLQVLAALCSISVLIWVSGYASRVMKADVDFLSLGLKGTEGVIWFWGYFATLVFAIFIVARVIRRGGAWTKPIHTAILSIPKLGSSLRTLALSRFTWTLHLTTEAGMSIRRALDLALRSTYTTYYTDHSQDIWQSIRRGGSVSESLEATGVFPEEFISAIEVGETSGRLPETLRVLSGQYQDEARRTLAFLMWLAGAAVSVMIGIVAVIIIFRFWTSYFGNMQNIANGH